MKKITKLLACVLMLFGLVSLASCEDISETIKELKKLAINEAMQGVAGELGVEEFKLPESDDINIHASYEEETDLSVLSLNFVEPTCSIDEYKDELVNYVEDAVSKYISEEGILDEVSFEPVENGTGYLWEYSFTTVNEDGVEETVSASLHLTKNGEDFALGLEIAGLGDLFSKALEEIEKANTTEEV